MRGYRSLLLFLALLGLGCAGAMRSHGGGDQGGGSQGGAATPEVSPSERTSSIQSRPELLPSSPALSMTLINNALYFLPQEAGGQIQLNEGTYIENSGSNDQLKVTLSDKMAFGDLDGDGNNDAAVVVISSRGDRNVYATLVAVVNNGGIAEPRAGVLLGDRVRINSVIILEREVLVDLTRRGPHDPLNAPTVRFKENYRLLGHDLDLLDSKQYR
jgi:hypothetical protein